MPPSPEDSSRIRPVEWSRPYLDHRPGSVLYRSGRTAILACASFAERTPPWLPSDRGWLTAEYALLPCSTNTRVERSRGPKLDGRTVEIQRLIGRALRASVDLTRMPGQQITIDCDVLVADGGTRTASICAATLALEGLLDSAEGRRRVADDPRTSKVWAISAGIVDGAPVLDLDYAHDSRAELDLNLVATASGDIVEIQGTSESDPIPGDRWFELVGLALDGVRQVEAAVASSRE